MEQNAKSWQETTKSIYTGVLLYSIANVLYSIFGSINTLMSFISLGGGNVTTNSFSTFCYILLICIIIGYFLFLKGLGDFRKIVNINDSNAVGKIFTGVILALSATVIDFIPFLGWLGTILDIIAFFFMMIGYSALKKSETFPSKGQTGASRLFTAMILSLIGAIIGFIPLVGSPIELILDIIAFFMTISGWACIKNSRPAEMIQNV